jgi:hypothetical protein
MEVQLVHLIDHHSIVDSILEQTFGCFRNSGLVEIELLSPWIG